MDSLNLNRNRKIILCTTKLKMTNLLHNFEINIQFFWRICIILLRNYHYENIYRVIFFIKRSKQFCIESNLFERYSRNLNDIDNILAGSHRLFAVRSFSKITIQYFIRLPKQEQYNCNKLVSTHEASPFPISVECYANKRINKNMLDHTKLSGVLKNNAIYLMLDIYL